MIPYQTELDRRVEHAVGISRKQGERVTDKSETKTIKTSRPPLTRVAPAASEVRNLFDDV